MHRKACKRSCINYTASAAEQRGARKSEVSTPRLLQLEINIDGISGSTAHAVGNGGDLENPAGGFKDGLVHDRVATRLRQRESADGSVALDGDLQHRREVVLVLRRDGGRLLPLAVKAVVNERVVGVDGSRVGAVAPCPTCSRAATLGGKECGLGRGVSLARTLAGRGRGGIAGFFFSLGTLRTLRLRLVGGLWLGRSVGLG